MSEINYGCHDCTQYCKCGRMNISNSGNSTDGFLELTGLYSQGLYLKAAGTALSPCVKSTRTMTQRSTAVSIFGMFVNRVTSSTSPSRAQVATAQAFSLHHRIRK